MDRRGRSANMQALLLYGSGLLLSMQIFGDYTPAMHAAVRVVYYSVVSGLVMLTGYQLSILYHSGADRRRYLSLAGKYYGLYILVGFCQNCLLSGKTVMSALMRMALLIVIPKYSEIFFSITMLAVVSMLLIPRVMKWMRHKILMGAVSVMLIAVIWFPSDLLGYPFVGAWFGTDVYRCIPLLAFGGYFLLGILAAGEEEEGRTLPWLAAVPGLAVTAGIFVWKYRAFAVSMHFPCSYWEVLFPVGLVLLFLLICRRGLLSEERRWLSGKPFMRTGIMILIFYILRVYGGYSDLKFIWRPVIFLCAWLAASVLSYLTGKLRVWFSVSLFGCGSMKRWEYILLYTVGFFLLSVIVFLPFIENNTSFLWYKDAVDQYFPKAVYFSQYIRDALQSILNGSFSLKSYDFTIGMGNRVQFSLDPVYWLYAIFAPDNMEMGYNAVTIFRFWLTGLCASAMFAYLKKSPRLTLLCSYIYIFSGYAIFAIVRHPQFSVGLTFLPLLVIAVEQILREKRWYLGSILIALSLLCSYYFLYMNTIALVIYFLVRFFCMEGEKRNIRCFMSYLGIFAGAYLLGVGMGNIALVNTFASYVSSARPDSGSIVTQSLMFYRTEWVEGAFMDSLTTAVEAGYWLRTGFIPLIYLCIVILFLKKGRRELKILCVISGICVLFPVVGYVLGGFSTVSNRWSYMLALLAAAAVAETLPLVRKLTARDVKILSASTLPYVLIAMLYSSYTRDYTLKAAALLLLTLTALLLSTDIVHALGRRERILVLMGVVVLSFYINGDVLYGVDGQNVVSQYTEAGKAYEASAQVDMEALVSLEDDSFYRVGESNQNKLKTNAAMILGVNSLSYYSSTINGRMQDFNVSMGNIICNLIKQVGYNDRTFLNELACVKYYSVEKDSLSKAMLPYGYELLTETETNGTMYLIYENQYSLPLGYTYTQTISLSEFEEYTPLQRQEIMLSAAVVEDETGQTAADEDSTPVITSQKITIDSIKCKGMEMTEEYIRGVEGQSVTFYFEGLPNSETYLCFRGYCECEETCVKIRVKDACGVYAYNMKKPDDTYYLELDEQVINCGYSEEGLTKVTIAFKNSGTIYYENLGIYCQPMDSYPDQVAALREDVLEDIEITGSSVSGTISLDEPKLLALSIPYQSGWTAYVDGEKADLLNVNIMYMGLELSAGDHSIVLRYGTPGFRWSLVVTALSVLVFVVLVIRGRRKRRKVQDSDFSHRKFSERDGSL